MKKLGLLLTIGIVFTSFRIHKNSTDPIVGKWYIFSQENVSAQAGFTKVKIDTINSGAPFAEFSDDGSFTSEEGNGRYLLKQDSIIMTPIKENESDNRRPIAFGYSLSDNDLTMSITETSSSKVNIYKLHLKRIL